MYEVSQEDFFEYSGLYTQNSIEENYKESKGIYSELNINRSNLTTLKDNLTRDYENFFMLKTNQEIENIKNNHGFAFEENFDKKHLFSFILNAEIIIDRTVKSAFFSSTSLKASSSEFTGIIISFGKSF